MEQTEWVTWCSARLHAQWPRVRREQRDEAPRELWEQEKWRNQEPEDAALDWLRQGIPNAAG